jgi:hypothetical protein
MTRVGGTQHFFGAPAIMAFFLLPLACSRKAPGPAECNEFALRAVGVRDERMLAIERVRTAVDNLTVQCLVTPFDRELLRCTEELGLRVCLADFQRRAGPSPAIPALD